jgi:glycosyltransferase involved in cell wall biosynthesis
VLIERGYPAERIRVLPLGVDLSVPPPRRDRELHERLSPDGRFLIGYVGRLVHEKGVDLLLRASQRDGPFRRALR